MAKVQHTVTGCVPVDKSALEAYAALNTKNKEVSAAEDDRQEAEGQGDYSDTTLYPNTRRAKEAARQAAETERIQNEGSGGPSSAGYSTSRIKMETDRQNAETQRQTNEGVGETDAECAVGSRRKNESIRQSNEETRQANEETRQTQEGTPNDEASVTGSRWARYKKAEADRNTSYGNEEGESTDEASESGSRWARFNKAQGDRTTAYNTAETARNTAIAPLVGCYECATAASTAAKVVSATSYILTSGGSVKVKFTYANTASSPTLNINSTGAKTIVYNGAVASSSNTWASGDVVEFYYDPTYNSNAGAFVGIPTVVSVSQNTLTTDNKAKAINVGGTDYNITDQDAQDKISQLGQYVNIAKGTATSVVGESVSIQISGYFKTGNDIRVEIQYSGTLSFGLSVLDSENRNLGTLTAKSPVANITLEHDTPYILLYRNEATSVATIKFIVTTGLAKYVREIDEYTVHIPNLSSTINIEQIAVTATDKYVRGGTSKTITPTDLANCECWVIPVRKGEKYKIYGNGASDIVPLLCTRKSDYSIIDKIEGAGEQYRTNPYELTINSDNVKYITVNSYNYVSSDRVEKLKSIDNLYQQIRYISDLDNNIVNEIANIYSKIAILGYSYYQSVPWTTPDSFSNRIYGEFKQGQTIRIKVGGDVTNKGFVIYLGSEQQTGTITCGKYRDITLVSDYSYIELVRSSTEHNGSYVSLQILYGLPLDDDKLHQEIIEQYALSVRLGGKKIICFGDSITEFKTNGKGYVEYLAEKSDAAVIRGGVGGTHLSARAVPVDIPSDITQAYAALDVCNLIDAWVNNSWTKVDAANAYLIANFGDDNTEQINNLKSNPISSADIVTIFAGTNDCNSSVPLGTNDSSDNTNICGALNDCINKILTANPAIKIFVFTPIVRYFGSVAEGNWSDVKENTLGLKLPQYAQCIMDCAKYNHIPSCDLYWTLGWNKINFAHWFGNDETHPTYGYEYLASKILSFILSCF